MDDTFHGDGAQKTEIPNFSTVDLVRFEFEWVVVIEEIMFLVYVGR